LTEKRLLDKRFLRQMKMRPPRLVIFASAFFFSLTGGAIAQQGAAARDIAEESAPAKSGAELVEAMQAYGASLEKVLKLYEAEFKKKAEEVRARREYYEKGYIARVELEAAQRELAGVEARLRETEQKIAEVKIGLAEATALERLSRLPPLRPGEYAERANWIRYAGRGAWSLRGAAAIEKFFLERFGRPLPVSALGQTAFHDRMRLDHREALDVALHPDSAEGRSLIDFLRRSGIPFIAFRNGVPGSASGAHIHIGRPSLRFNAR
jgi:hypothetical protein